MIRTFPALVFALLLPFFAPLALAQTADEGLSDPTFNVADADGYGSGANGTVRAIAVQADGRILIGGDFTQVNDDFPSFLDRLEPDGKRALPYAGGGTLNGAVHAIAIDSSGKAIIGGDFTTASGSPRPRLARLRLDGFNDLSFTTGLGPNGRVSSIVIQPDGKILIAGAFTTYAGQPRNRIARINSDGSLDTSFVPGTGPNADISSIALLANGSILAGGNFTSWNNFNFQRVVRLNALGGLDTSFNSADFNGPVLALGVQSDGKIVVGGAFTTVDGLARQGLARLLSTGARDTAFTGSVNGTVHAVRVQPDDRILAGGEFTSFLIIGRQRLLRLTASGGLDTSFNTGSSSGADGTVLAIALDGSGELVIGGDFDIYGGRFRRRFANVKTDGSLDTTFNPAWGANDLVYAVEAQPDGKILVAGAFTYFNDRSHNRLVRLNEDGTNDTTFVTGSGFVSSVLSSCAVIDLVVEPGGKIVAVGVFSHFNGTARSNIVRLNPDGSLDATFAPGSGASDVISCIDRTVDGKYLIGGLFTNYGGTARGRFARVLSSGAIDLSFGTVAGASGGIVESIAADPSGGAWLGGSFTQVNGVARAVLARVTSNGATDLSFAPTSGFAGIGAGPTVHDIAVQPDGRVIVAGSFTAYNGTPRFGLARILPSGGLDTSFVTGTGTVQDVQDCDLLPDGRLLVAGSFDSFNSVATDGVARLLPGGQLDPEFQLQFSNGGSARSIALLPDGRSILGGGFVSLHSRRRHGLARLRIASVKVYCTGKVNSAGCVPSIGTNGFLPAYSSSLFSVTCSSALNQRSGLLFYGTSSIATPFQGGTLCVATPVRRTAVQGSGGSAFGSDCTGTHEYFFTQPDYDAAGIVGGDIVFCQWWMRDPASPSTTSLSNALRFSVLL